MGKREQTVLSFLICLESFRFKVSWSPWDVSSSRTHLQSVFYDFFSHTLTTCGYFPIDKVVLEHELCTSESVIKHKSIRKELGKKGSFIMVLSSTSLKLMRQSRSASQKCFSPGFPSQVPPWQSPDSKQISCVHSAFSQKSKILSEAQSQWHCGSTIAWTVTSSWPRQV